MNETYPVGDTGQLFGVDEDTPLGTVLVHCGDKAASSTIGRRHARATGTCLSYTTCAPRHIPARAKGYGRTHFLICALDTAGSGQKNTYNRLVFSSVESVWNDRPARLGRQPSIAEPLPTIDDRG